AVIAAAASLLVYGLPVAGFGNAWKSLSTRSARVSSGSRGSLFDGSGAACGSDTYPPFCGRTEGAVRVPCRGPQYGLALSRAWRGRHAARPQGAQAVPNMHAMLSPLHALG